MAKIKILVAEDEQDIADIFRIVLESKGYEPIITANGEEALKQIHRHQPELLILDVMMPKMSGYTLVKELKKDAELAGISIIMVSAISQGSNKPDEFWQQGMGVEDYITKPFDPSDLLRRVENLLRKKREGWLDKEKQPFLMAQATGATPGATVKPTPIEEQKPHPLPESGKRVERAVTPEDVVKTFIESWNSQAFDKEYLCLSNRLHGNLDLVAYVQRRKSYYQESKAMGSLRQELRQVISVSGDQHDTKVTIIRADIRAGREQQFREVYTLALQEGKWQITNVRRLPPQ
ncbi:MAG: response regulator [bacterium]|nr:response regulator [bacterium]